MDDRADPIERRRFRVRGRVQGVAFRASAARAARDLGLAGWVRNLPDGSVEAAAEGPADRLDAFLAWLERGPPLARVTAVEATVEPLEGLAGFDVRY